MKKYAIFEVFSIYVSKIKFYFFYVISFTKVIHTEIEVHISIKQTSKLMMRKFHF